MPTCIICGRSFGGYSRLNGLDPHNALQQGLELAQDHYARCFQKYNVACEKKIVALETEVRVLREILLKK